MKRFILMCTLICFVLVFTVEAQQQTADGGHIIGGTTYSYTHGTGSNADILVYKLDAAGTKQWRKNYGGDDSDYFGQVIQTADGGYAVCGYTYSYTHGTSDFLVYRLNAAGSKLWRKNYGGSVSDYCRRIIQTADGGFAVSGTTYSYTNGGSDFLVYRINAAGQKLWRKNYGGGDGEYGGYVSATSDGGFLLCGYSYTYSIGSTDILIYKLDAAGNKQWRKNYGGAATENGKVARQTADGGYLVAGHSNSYSGPPSGKGIPAYYDMIVYKLDASGAKQWRKTYGGSDNDSCYDLILTAGGGFVAFGFGDSYSYDGTDDDFLAYRLDSAGAKLWRKNYGGAEHDLGYFTYQTGDGGFVFVGEGDSYCQTGADVDLLVYKVNSAGVKLWRKNFGGDDDEFIESK